MLLAPSTLVGGPRSDRGSAKARLQTLAEEFLARRLARAPHSATRRGIHASQPLAPQLTAAALAGDLGWLHEFRQRLATVPHDPPGVEQATERALLEAAVERDLVELEVIRPLQRDPGAYLELLAGAVERALDGTNGSPCACLEHAAGRLAEVPEVLRAARLNLKDPPRVLTELAVERCAGVLRFFREDVSRLVAGCRSARMQADLAQADTTAVRAIEAFQLYLSQDLLPATRGELAIGPEACRRLLRAELVDEVAPVETLLAAAAHRVERCRAELDSSASLVAAGGARASLDSLALERLDDGGWAPLVARGVERVEAFLGGRRIVTLPSRPTLRVRAARSFRKSPAITLSYDVGRRDLRATPAWLEVGALDPPVSGRDGGAWLGRLNRWEIDLAVAHEGLPGRYLRAVALRAGAPSPSRVLQETWSGEDWGQFCERMMLDEGFGGEHPRYRLAGAARALHHAGRALAALGLHAGAMTPDQARRMLEDRCLHDPDVAEREVRWAAADPALMGDAIGAERLRELQSEARRRLGPHFRAQAFNDAVLRFGASPSGIVRARLWRELGETVGDDRVEAKP